MDCHGKRILFKRIFSRSYSDKTFLPNTKSRIIKRSRKSKQPVDSVDTRCKPAEVTVPAEIGRCVSSFNGNQITEMDDVDTEMRVNNVNIQMLSKNVYEQLFGRDETMKTQPSLVSRSQAELKHHGIDYTNCSRLPEVKIDLPLLAGKDIIEHFYNIGENQSAPYRKLIYTLVEANLPQIPKEWLMKTGWHRYTDTGPPEPVPFPPDDALVFDVEVCMSAGSHPTLACAVSPTAWYGWVSQALIDGTSQNTDKSYLNLENLIPLESDPTSKGYNHKATDKTKTARVVVGHNVSYDRAKVREQYYLNTTGLRFVDTMSMHVCVSGVTSYQRNILKSKKEIDVEDENWVQNTSLNSLKEVHKLYCGSDLSKESRDIFVEGSLTDVKANFQQLMHYCAGDVTATARVLKQLFPMFMERFPHPVTLAGMIELGTAYLPVNSNWLQYIESADTSFEDSKLETRQLLSLKADKACQLMQGEKYKEDLWMWDQDWSTQLLKLKKEPSSKKKATKIQEENELLSKNNGNYSTSSEVNRISKNVTLDTNNNEKLIKIDEKFIKELIEANKVDENIPEIDGLEEKFKHLFNLKNLLPVKRPLLPGYPAWYRKLCTKPNDMEDWTPGAHNISTSMQITPKLLCLSWEGYPLHYIREHGWGFLVPGEGAEESGYDEGSGGVPLQQLLSRCPVVQFDDTAGEMQSELALHHLWKDVEQDVGKRDYFNKNKKDINRRTYRGNGVLCGARLGQGCHFLRLPHKDGASHKVGNPLAKDFLNKFSENVLTGGGTEAEKVLMFARMMSYWRNNRDRIKGQQVVWLPAKQLPPALRDGGQYGAILPQVLVCGTLTRRAMEPTWMTASNANPERIGSELRAMVQAPPGYSFVGADVDSQELWIASLLGDGGSGMHGGTALGWSVLAGSKAAGSDLHSRTAAAANVSRDHAKVINYARIYGAGQNFAERLLKQFNPTMSDSEAKSKAIKMFTTTKGRRVYRMKSKYLENFMSDDLMEEGEGRDEVQMTAYQANRLAKLSGKRVDEMFEKPVWVGGTESAMFNKLEEIADSAEPRTPFLGCRLTRALEGSSGRWSPTRVNWAVQSGAVDFLHLMLVNMRWLAGEKIRFSLSFHDEVRYLVPDEYKYETALALHITNLYTRAFCSKRVGLNDLPQSVAFFTSVEVDKVLRKDAAADCITPSNPHGLMRGYGIGTGEALDAWAALEKGAGLKKLIKGNQVKMPKKDETATQ